MKLKDFFDNNQNFQGESNFGYEKIFFSEKIDGILEKIEENKKNLEKRRKKREEKEKNFYYEHDLNIKTKFILENLRKNLENKDFEINDASYFFSLLSQKSDLENHKEEINFLFEEIIKIFINYKKNIFRSEFANFLLFVNSLEKGILSEKNYKNILEILYKNTKTIFAFSSFDYLLIYIKDNNIDISDDSFIDFFLESLFFIDGFIFTDFQNISEFLLENEKTRNIFLKKFLDLYEKNQTPEFRKIFFSTIELLKDFQNKDIDKNILEKIQVLILNSEKIKSEKDLEFKEIIKIIYGFTMMNQETINKNTLNFCFDEIMNSNLELEYIDILRIIIGLQNFPKNYIKREFLDFLEEKILENLENCSIFILRNLLYYNKNLGKKFSENTINKLFEKLENIENIIETGENDENILKNLIEDYRGENIENVNIIYLLLVQVYNLYNKKIPEKLEKKYKTDVIKDEKMIIYTKDQMKIYKELKEKYENIEFSIYKFGFEMDIFVPELKLNIELDGAHHNLGIKKLKDKIRDNFLKSKGIKVQRILGRKNMRNFLDEIKK